ncbi:hypothetical protein DL96DRAFT_126421 [Flagelloscypha sp. PMI_526]|nr:hypothetical protein DL96DRAFT_126421 [Flagelloscypha sp. PMI_526]
MFPKSLIFIVQTLGGFSFCYLDDTLLSRISINIFPQKRPHRSSLVCHVACQSFTASLNSFSNFYKARIQGFRDSKGCLTLCSTRVEKVTNFLPRHYEGASNCSSRSEMKSSLQTLCKECFLAFRNLFNPEFHRRSVYFR